MSYVKCDCCGETVYLCAKCSPGIPVNTKGTTHEKEPEIYLSPKEEKKKGRKPRSFSPGRKPECMSKQIQKLMRRDHLKYGEAKKVWLKEQSKKPGYHLNKSFREKEAEDFTPDPEIEE